MRSSNAVDEHGEMKQEVYNLAAYAIEQFVTEAEISKHIKVNHAHSTSDFYISGVSGAL